jgi:5-methylcytosine-specific restriction endonuclease McrA
MPRSVEEWVGKTDDAMPPPRVRMRALDANDFRCHCCGRVIRPGEYWQLDHVVALINGGQNRESNLRPICRDCCYAKTALDVAKKAKVARVRQKHYGLKKPKRPMPGSRASGFRKRMDGTVERR